MDIGKLREKGGLELVDNRYYNGFEGEPEIQFVYKKDNDTDIFIIWEGYFDQIMRLIKPDENGWNGMAYCYNMYTGWYEKSPWNIENLHLALRQFESIEEYMLNKEAADVLKKICDILKKAIVNKAEVSIVRE